MEIVFVCTGNTCRSIMAERIAKKMAKERKMELVKFSSCGVDARRENIAKNAQIALKEYGYDGRDRKSVKLKKLKPSAIYVAVNSALKKFLVTARLIEKNVEVLLDKIEKMRGEK